MEPVKNICTENIKIIDDIYKNIYQEIKKNVVDVFLCGGKSTKEKKSVRDTVRNELWQRKDIRILYPEDLFLELLNTNKNYNLLDLENFLAFNCDLICIICESPGALVELGAFVNNKKIIDKVIAVIEKNKTKKTSFIMLGPAKLIKQKNPKNLFMYEEKKLDILTKELIKRFSIHRTKPLSFFPTLKDKHKINTIIGMYYFIPLLLYFFSAVESIDLATSIKELLKRNKFKNILFDQTYKSALTLLQKERLIEKKMISDTVTNININYYILTKTGYKNVLEMLNNINIAYKTMLYDKIRFDIMDKKYYHYLS